MMRKETPGRKWWKTFRAEYARAGGWTGYQTRCWVEGAALYLFNSGCSARSAGRVLADKEQKSKNFSDFVKSGGPTAHVIYSVLGSGGLTSGDRRMLVQIENGAHVEDVVSAAK